MTTPIFHPNLMRLKRLSLYKARPEFCAYLEGINKIRKNYQWSKKIYNESNAENVFLVCCKDTFFGFVEAEYCDLDLNFDRRSYIFVHEIHFAPSMQRRAGAGTAVIRYLLNKGLDLEFVIVKANTKVEGLINKFKYIERYVNEHTRTIRIGAWENRE